jgi:3-hydroxyisobutyrate dehydrogenase-like beta-hydroxyacid dehydrogenase
VRMAMIGLGRMAASMAPRRTRGGSDRVIVDGGGYQRWGLGAGAGRMYA